MSNNFHYWHKISEILLEGGMTKYPYIHQLCKYFWETGNYQPLKEFLDKNSNTLIKARRNIAEIEKAVSDCPFRPFPSDDEIETIKGDLNLGYVNHNFDMAGLNPLDFTRGFTIFGEIGAGKTYPALRLYDQILSIPREQRSFNVLIFQIVKRDADFLIKQHPDLRVIEWHQFRRNIFQIEQWDCLNTKFHSAHSIFSSVNYLMSLAQPILKYAIQKCYKKNKVYEGTNDFPTFSEIYAEIEYASAEIGLRGYEKKNLTDKLKIRLMDFMATGQILDCKYGYTIESFWSQEDICFNVVDEQSEYIYGTAIMDLLIDLQRYYESQPSPRNQLNTLIGLDECRSLFPRAKDYNEFNPNRFMEKFITTARSSGIGRIAITQEPQSVSSWLTNNSAFILTLPIAGEAIDHIKKLQNLTDEQVKYIDELPERGTGIFRDRRFNRPYLVQIPGDLDIEDITVDEVSAIMTPFIDTLISQLPKPIIKSCDAPMKFNIAETKKQSLGKLYGLKILDLLLEKPFIFYTSIRESLEISAQMMDMSYRWLLDNDLVITKKCISPSGKKAKYLALTELAYRSYGVSRHKQISASHFKHTLYCEHVKNWLEMQGHKVFREYRILPGEKELKDSGRIDVYVNNIAYEITLTMNKQNILTNVYKCLGIFKVEQLNLVCETKRDAETVEAIITGDITSKITDKILYKSITEFI